MELRMTKPETGYSSRGRTGRNCLRSRWRAVPVRVGSIFCLRCSCVKAELEWFAEGFLRLVVLVAVPFVKPVCALANHVGAHVHSRTAPPSRPFFRRFEQLGSGSQAALAFRNDEPVDFGTHLALQQVCQAHMNPAHDTVAGFQRLSDKHSMLRNRRELSQSLRDLRACCRIAKLPRKLCKPLRVVAPRFPDLHFHLRCRFCCRRHLFTLPFAAVASVRPRFAVRAEHPPQSSAPIANPACECVPLRESPNG